MKRMLVCGLVVSAVLVGALSAQGADFRFSFGFGAGYGGGYHGPYPVARPYYAFRPYSYPYFGYPAYFGPYRPGFGAVYYRSYYPAPGVRYYGPKRVYSPYPYAVKRVYPSDRGYVDYTPRRYHRER
jgi:hypothetical protein